MATNTAKTAASKASDVEAGIDMLALGDELPESDQIKQITVKSNSHLRTFESFSKTIIEPYSEVTITVRTDYELSQVEKNIRQFIEMGRNLEIL